MNSGQNKTVIALGSVVAVLLLLGAFLLVWLVPRGPGVGNANVQSGSGSTSNIGAKSVDNAPASTNFSPSGAPSMAQLTDQPNISVRGTGIVSAKPDLINLQVGVQIQKPALADAQAEAATKMDAVTNQLKSAGIEEKDIATAQFHVEPVMNYRDNQPPQVTGFRVTNIVNVKIRDITKASKLVDDLVASGANTIYGLSFGFSDPTALMSQAREQAMKDARAKAEQLAQLGGVGLGAPIMISDGGQNVPPPVLDAMASREMAQAGAPATPINPGQQEIHVEVSVMYAIK